MRSLPLVTGIVVLAICAVAQTNSSLEQSAKAIIETKCLVCHGVAASSGLDLRQRESMLQGGKRGPAVVPGNSNESLLVRAVLREGELKMPPGNVSLAPEEIRVLASWIDQGAVWDSPAVKMQEPAWWSFRQAKRPVVPEVKQRELVRTPIDAFIVAKLEENGLRVAPRADKRTLIRRAYFDLIGLPPTAEQVDSFVKDPSPNAFEELVDRLLASPQYGERWGRHWLDVVRYADSVGYETDMYLRYAFRYRDYVVKSFNEDKPYDRFVQEQIAGDEIWPNDLALEGGSYEVSDEKVRHMEARIGTGMYAVGPEIGESNTDIKKLRYEKLTDWADVTGAAFMGLTLGCARCHDHKFDPITQRDYYRLQGIFSASREEEISIVDRMQIRFRDMAYVKVMRLADLRTLYKRLEEGVRERAVQVRKAQFPAEVIAAFEKVEEQRTSREQELAAPLVKDVESISLDKETTAEERLELQDLREQMAKLVIDLPSRPGGGPKPGLAFDGLTDVATARVLGNYQPELIPNVHILNRGELEHPKEKVTPGLPAVLAGNAELETDCSGRCVPRYRKQLALWLTQPEHPLTARVMVNRIWYWHFGRGLVNTLNDFGHQGQSPSHPELLDWLATEFVSRGWSVKAMHRLMLLSNVYQLSSQFSDQNNARIDPQNQYVWKMNRRRLEAEGLWDTMHAVAGTLSLKMGGPPVVPPIASTELAALHDKSHWMVSLDPEDQRRRGIYILVRRNFQFPMFRTFDGADNAASCPERQVSTVAPQALWLMNNSISMRKAKDLASRVIKEAGEDPSSWVDHSWRLALQRPPSEQEKSEALALIADLAGPSATPVANQAALEKLCLAILNLSEFNFVD